MQLTNPDGHAPILSEGNAPKGPVVWVLAESGVQRLIAAIQTSESVTVDLETTGLEEHAVTGGTLNGGVAARIALASFTLPQAVKDDTGMDVWDGQEPTTYILPLSHPQGPFAGVWKVLLGRVMQAAVDAHRPIENQNVKFDAKWIYATTGVDIAHLLTWDTQVGAHLLDERTSTKLKVRAPAIFGIEPWDDVDFSIPGAAEREDIWKLGEYAARDTYWTWRSKVQQRRQMFLDGEEVADIETDEDQQNFRLGKLAVWVAMPTVASLTSIEQNGIKLDVPWTRERLAEAEHTYNEAMDELSKRYDLNRSRASTASTSYWFRDLTQRAVEAGDLRVAAMTAKGNSQWTKGVLNRQTREPGTREVATLILRARSEEKSAQYLRSWLDYADKNGMIHTTYWPGRVVTGRLSSEAPNMQQVSRKLKQAFVPRDGFYIVDLDYGQIELRVAAFIAQEKKMIQAFKDGKDLHRMIAARGARKAEEDVTDSERQRGKAGNFGLLYGMSAYGFKEYADDNYGVLMTDQEANEFHRMYFNEMWPGIKPWHARVVSTLHAKGEVTSPLGRVRRLPGVWDANPKMVSFSERAAINSPVQGMASDFMMMAAASIQGVLPGSTAVQNSRLIGTVHDSIVAEVPMKGWESIVEQMQERMTSLDRVLAKMGLVFDVPLVADASVGTRWGFHDIAEM